MRAAKKSIAAGNALGPETNGFVGATRANIVGKNTKPNPMSVRVFENPKPGRETAMRLRCTTRSGEAQSRTMANPIASESRRAIK
jgi:hypothetical protein